MRPHVALAAILLGGCAPSFPAFDRDPPDLVVLRDGLDGPVVFTTRADRAPADTTCPDGSRPYLPSGTTAPERRRLTNENHILPAGMERALLIFAVTDPSGVERVELGFPTRGVAPITTEDPPVVSVPLPGGGREDRYTYSHAALRSPEEHPLRSAHLFAIEAAIDANAPAVRFELALIDGRRGGPNIGTRRFSVARPEAVCG